MHLGLTEGDLASSARDAMTPVHHYAVGMRAFKHLNDNESSKRLRN